MAVSGLIMIVFLLVHMYGNLKMFVSPEAYDHYAHWLKGLTDDGGIMAPIMPYECMGDVPNVTFPCASLHDPETGRIAVYYGCADTVTGLAFGYIPEIIDFTKQNSIL